MNRKAEILIAVTEGTITSFRLVFPNGLVLNAKISPFWTGDEKRQVKEKFYEVVDELKQTGWDVR